MLQKIISGGQTGADRAALDVAIKFDIPHGGWIPKGRKTEDGVFPDKYQLQEMPTASYPKRTEKNVLDSDGILILIVCVKLVPQYVVLKLKPINNSPSSLFRFIRVEKAMSYRLFLSFLSFGEGYETGSIMAKDMLWQ